MAMQPENKLSCLWRTEDPDKSLDQEYWKKIFISSCLCAILIDPLFLYIPILKDDIKCLMLDPKLKIAVILLRLVTDIFYLIDIIIRIYRSENYSDLIVKLRCRQNRMNFIFVLRSGVSTIAKTIWTSKDILIDIVAILPLLQVAILIFFSKMSDLRSLTTTRMVLMNVFALLQYMPRVLRIYLSSMELKRTLEEEIRETPIWIKGVLNFCMYIIASHIVGALWYFFAIQRMMVCWHSACRKDDGCDNRIFGCHDHHLFRNTTILNDLCPVSVSDNSSDTMHFDFGIFVTVLQFGVVGSTNYFQKFLNCFWWGLRNLSSLGSNLEPSVDGWENLYTVSISITGLLLFLYLIGNLQMYMQVESTRTENRMQMRRKMKGKDKEIELWLFKNGIPTMLNQDIKLQIRDKVKQALEEYTDANLDNILPLLPQNVQSRIKEFIPLSKLKQGRMFQLMDEGVWEKIYQKFEPVRYTENEDIIQKDQPLDKILFIVDGHVSIEERSCDSDSSKRGAGELFGEELLCWPFSKSFHHTKPLATETVKAIDVVEALALKAHDLKSIYDQPNIAKKEKTRHRRMMKEKMEQDIDRLIRINVIPEKLNPYVKSPIMEKVEELFQGDKDVYWDTLVICRDALPFDLDNLVSLLPLEFQDGIKRNMPLTKLKEMPAFKNMEESVVLKKICRHLQPKKYNRYDNIIQKGDPIQMFFIVEGAIALEGCVKGAGESYGGELLVWPFSTSFPDRVPTTAAESVKANTTVVEALVLKASDMKSVAIEFRKHFIKNYGRLLQNLVNCVSPISTTLAPSSSEAVLKFFTEEELEEATRNCSDDDYVNEEGYGIFYHSKLHGRDVVIKRCNSTTTTGEQYIQSQRLVQEAFVLSEFRHKNVVRLLGCCLATKWPIMVYDYDGTYAWTLSQHIHVKIPALYSLESRMKIAADTAGALACLHSMYVIHRDVRTQNILIDRTTYIARVSGFGFSRLLHEDEDEMEDDVSTLPETSVYLDPEYLKSHVLTEKSDVYGFGVVLVELLTRRKPVSYHRPEGSLANKFVCSVQEGRLNQILDYKLMKDELSFEIAKKVSELAVTCLRSRGEERPSMEKVAVELEAVVQTIINSTKA
ncbi:hypothetical protein D8674_023143 [Pyrus ussuriensis x Pyrus communis]|uniref:Cyclic nucleotide-gated ion channel 1-like n=1 Tax=Pyrus ussuriensis x Pyrus communis TaxID=2448454 RepID=A0A5N5GLY8_9ROSA|nr:hypothetical protein D8674_023143 [Pyrus ussuriensis x Pyrus communis]